MIRPVLARTVLLAASALLASGCAQAILSLETFRGRSGYDEAAARELAARANGGSPTKAEVLTVLGPPSATLVQTDGEVFLYRSYARDEATLDLSPGFVGAGANVPVYYRSEISGRDDVIMVFFGRDGRMRGVATRASIDDVEGSTAARLGEVFEDELFRVGTPAE